ncbi:MAG: hypothetical protein ACP5LJ_07465 [Candidatus Bipolaricaulaceae bacterium]
MRQVRHLLLAAVLGSFCLLSLPALGETYSNVAAVLELGMGARPMAMGGAFVGLADDGNSLLFNSAGLANLQSLSVLSSGEVRPDISVYGQMAVALPHFGLSLHYFDFGNVPQTDNLGNVTGYFSYRTYTLIAGAGIRGADLGLKNVPLLRDLGVGIKVKYLKVSTLDPGSGSGLAFDLAFLYGGPNTGLRIGFLTGLGLGFVLENVVGVPIRYGSGHVEDWSRAVTVGLSATLFNSWTFAADFAAGKGVRVGLEWCPLSAIAVRAGLRSEGVVMWSLGIGVRYGMFTLDYAFVTHPYMAGQHRLSLELGLWANKAR